MPQQSKRRAKPGPMGGDAQQCPECAACPFIVFQGQGGPPLQSRRVCEQGHVEVVTTTGAILSVPQWLALRTVGADVVGYPLAECHQHQGQGLTPDDHGE